MITCFTTIDDRIELLPYFVKYYRSIGVDHIIASVRRGPNNPLWTKILAFSSEQPISVVHGSDAEFQSGSTDNEHRNIIRQGVEGWHVIADLDEFHWFGGQKVPDVVKLIETAGAHGAYLLVVDRVTADGSLPEIGGPLDDLFPMRCNLTQAIGANICKAGLMKAGATTGAAAHYAPWPMLVNGYEAHHFKWSAGVIERTQRRKLLWETLPPQLAFRDEPEHLLARFKGERLNMGLIQTAESVKIGI